MSVFKSRFDSAPSPELEEAVRELEDVEHEAFSYGDDTDDEVVASYSYIKRSQTSDDDLRVEVVATRFGRTFERFVGDDEWVERGRPVPGTLAYRHWLRVNDAREHVEAIKAKRPPRYR